MKFRLNITTDNGNYVYEIDPAIDDKTGILRGDRIDGEMKGLFISEVEIGGRPVFVLLEDGLLITDESVVFVRAREGIRLSEIQKITDESGEL